MAVEQGELPKDSGSVVEAGVDSYTRAMEGLGASSLSLQRHEFIEKFGVDPANFGVASTTDGEGADSTLPSPYTEPYQL